MTPAASLDPNRCTVSQQATSAGQHMGVIVQDHKHGDGDRWVSIFLCAHGAAQLEVCFMTSHRPRPLSLRLAAWFQQILCLAT
jgi:hypothetical protein